MRKPKMAQDIELTMNESGRGSRRWLLPAVAAVLLVAGGGGGIWWWLAGTPAPVSASMDQGNQPLNSRGESTLYVPMPRPFLFNVRGEERDRLVQIKVQLMVRSKQAEELATQHIPLIEGTLLQVFSAATVDQLSSLEGKEGIRERAVIKVQEELSALSGSNVVDKVLFTGFVMQ